MLIVEFIHAKLNEMGSCILFEETRKRFSANVCCNDAWGLCLVDHKAKVYVCCQGLR